MTFRSGLFWVHLTAGVVAGTVIMVMSVTGTLLAFQQSVLRGIERSQRYVVVPPGATALPLDDILARVKAAIPEAEPATITVEADPASAVGGRDWHAGYRLREPLHRRGAWDRIGAGARLLSDRDQLASLPGAERRPPRDRQGDHRRVQCGVPAAGGQRPLFVVAAAVEQAACRRGDVVPRRAARQGARLQLAQHYRSVVRAGADRADHDRDGDLLRVGIESRLHGHGQSAAGGCCRAARRARRWARRWRARRRAAAAVRRVPTPRPVRTTAPAPAAAVEAPRAADQRAV